MSRWTSDSPWLRFVALAGPLGLGTLLLIGASPLAAQAPVAEPPELVMELYTFRHRPAREAIDRVEDLLSAQGTVELQPRGNTLVVRDTAPVIKRVLARLRAYDQPLRQVRLEIQIVHAGASDDGPVEGPRLSAELARRLRELLRFETFTLLAEAGLEMREGEQVAYHFGGGYRVEFELGVLNPNRQLRLADFIVGRGPVSDVRPLIHTNLNLTLDRPMVLGLAQTEASERALMVVLTTHLMEQPDR